MSKNCIITTVKSKIKGNATSYIERESEIFIPISKKFTLNQTRAMAQDKVNIINKEYLSKKFGEVVSLNSSYTDGTGINIHPSQRLVDAYEVKEGNKTIEEVNPRNLEYFNGDEALLEQEQNEDILIQKELDNIVEQTNNIEDKTDTYFSITPEVNYNLKASEILSSSKADEVFRKGDKNNWSVDKMLTELQVPQEQKDLLLSFNTRNREELLTNLLANYSYTVEINTAKDSNKLIDWENNPNTTYFEFTVDNIRYTDSTYGYYYKRLPNTSKDVEISEEEYNKAKIKSSKNPEAKPTSYYSNLTVPGGTNYTENEIAIPGVEVQEKPQGVEKKEGVDFVFEQNPELANIGTPAQYSQYLDTIFPDSKVKDIVYHGSKYKFETFDKSKLGSNTNPNKEFPQFNDSYLGFHFTSNPEYYRGRHEFGSKYEKNLNEYIAILNIKKPKDIADKDDFSQNNIEFIRPEEIKNNDSIIYDYLNTVHYEKGNIYTNNYVVFEPEQIHILGNKQDIEGFKNFIKSNTKTVRKGAITPSIKGHAQFSTDNGIGWFRSDDKIEFLDKEDLIRKGIIKQVPCG